MPYKILHKKGNRPWKIVRSDTGEVVGSSMTRKMAVGSMAHREDAMKGESMVKSKKRKSAKKGKK